MRRKSLCGCPTQKYVSDTADSLEPSPLPTIGDSAADFITPAHIAERPLSCSSNCCALAPRAAEPVRRARNGANDSTPTSTSGTTANIRYCERTMRGAPYWLDFALAIAANSTSSKAMAVAVRERLTKIAATQRQARTMARSLPSAHRARCQLRGTRPNNASDRGCTNHGTASMLVGQPRTMTLAATRPSAIASATSMVVWMSRSTVRRYSVAAMAATAASTRNDRNTAAFCSPCVRGGAHAVLSAAHAMKAAYGESSAKTRFGSDRVKISAPTPSPVSTSVMMPSQVAPGARNARGLSISDAAAMANAITAHAAS